MSDILGIPNWNSNNNTHIKGIGELYAEEKRMYRNLTIAVGVFVFVFGVIFAAIGGVLC